MNRGGLKVQLLSGLFGIKNRAAAILPRLRLVWQTPPTAIYAIGDVHGSLTLFEQLESEIDSDARQYDSAATIVLGDLLDRGPSSAQLLDYLLLERGHRHPRYCLIGNHEALFLEFFADPSLKADWLDVGGLDTLASYGISPGSLAKHRKALQELLLSHVPIEHLNFLNSLPVMISTPSHVFVHAGVRTELSLSSQEDDDLLWCKDNFDHNYEAFDKIVVHGHTPRTKPLLKGNRISIDTGAYMTGRLSAVCIARNRAPYVLSVSATASRAAANSPAMHV